MSATVHTAIRLNERDHDELKRRAKAHDLTFTRYVVEAGLGRLNSLPLTLSDAGDKLDDLECRVQRLEDHTFGGT